MMAENEKGTAKLNQIIKGLDASDGAILSSEVGFNVDERPYYALIFTEMEPTRGGAYTEILSCAQKLLSAFGQGTSFPGSNSELICYLSGTQHGDNELLVKDFAFRMIETVRNETGAGLSCGISLECRGADAFREAYLQAESALGKAFYTGVYAINTFSALNIARDRRDAARLKALIQDDLAKANPNDPGQLLSVLEELKAYASMTELRWEYIIGLYLDVIYAAFSMADEEKTPDYRKAEWLTLALPTARTIRQLHKTAGSILSVLCSVQAVPGNETGVIRQIKDYISDNIANQLSLHDIAAHVYMNPTYLSQFFKQKTGENLRAYITAERISKAKQYLSQDQSIHETAQLTGFASDSYFIQCFKDATGLTPREFIRNHRLDCC